MKINTLNLNYERAFNKYLFIFAFLLCNVTFAQQKLTVSGVVNDTEGNMPLPGVNIIEKNTTNGTTTDFDGNFTLSVSGTNSVLVISYVGYQTQEITVGNKTSFTVDLVADVAELNEVVLVGYGTQKKKDLTGSVGSLDATIMTERNVTDPMEAIQGNVAGVNISNSSGRLGDGFDITIRGQNSFSGGSPLYIVDGVPSDGIDFLNPNDIQSIDILKDASSTAIYGSRGTNGVVLVTTKNGSGAKRKVTVSYDTFYGIKNPARMPEFMDTAEWFDYHMAAYLGNNPMSWTPESLYNSVIGSSNSLMEERVKRNETFDWTKAVLQPGTQSNNFVSVSGRADNGLAYTLGAGIQTETGNVENESVDKYTFKSSVNHKINDKFSAGATVSISLSETQKGSSTAMRDAFRLAPVMTPYGLDGELFPLPGKLTDADGNFLINKTSNYNPLLDIKNSSDETKRWNMIGNIFAEYRPLDWMSFKTTFSTGLDDRRRGRSWGAMTGVGVANNNLPSADLENFQNFNYTWDNQMNINKTFNEDHSINFLALQSLYSSTTEGSSMSSRNMPFDTEHNNIGSGEQSTFAIGSYFHKQTLASFALRLNYSYKDRYLLTVSNRWDGSSLFAEGNQWDSFPSFALAWRISEEAFMENVNFLSNLKLRGSYGFTGNNVVDPYSTKNILDYQTYYEFNGTTANGWLPSNLSNSALVWERTRESNFGVDFGFFNERIYGSVDIYDRLSEDLLFEQQLPLESGWGTTMANVGSISNKGVEVALTTVNVNTEKVRWETTFTFAKNNNKIEEIYGDGSDDIGNGLFVGQPLGAYYNYVFDGIWQEDERDLARTFGQRPGQAKVKDLNGDGKITADQDRQIIGSTQPDWTGGLTSRLNVGHFDLGVSVITSQGNMAFSEFHREFLDVEQRGRQRLSGIDYYVPENSAGLTPSASNTVPQPRNEGSYWNDEGVAFYKDASFVKVKNISLGYAFDQETLDKLKLSYLRIYANVLDPFVFTDYEGFDPEWATADLRRGGVGSVTYQLGLSVKF